MGSTLFTNRLTRRQLAQGTAAFGAAALAGAAGTPGFVRASAQEASTPTPVRGGTLIASTALEMTSIDPNVNSGSQHISTLWLEGLVSIAEDGQIVPFLAESWDISGDGQEYTFHLRPDVLFHNGDPLTADDVVFSLERTMDPALGAPRQSSLLDVETVTALDEHTVTLTLSQPFGPLLANLAEVWIVPRASAGADGLITEPIGTGPFRFVSWVTNQETVTERFDDYWQPGLPYLDGVTVKVITDDTTRMAALRSGEVHQMQGFPANLLATIAEGGFAFEPILDPSTWTLVFNLNNPPAPIDDVRVRRAIALALNKQELMQSRIGDAPVGETSKMPSSSGEFWYVPEVEDPFPAQNLEMAAQLLAEAGYADGLPPLMLPATVEAQRYVEVMAGQLSAAGIDAQIDIVDRTANRERMEQFDWHITLNVTGPRTDPSQKYATYYSGAAAEGKANPNLPAVDDLYEAAIRVTEPEARRELWGDLWRVMQEEEVAAVSLWHDANVYAFTDKLRGFKPGRTFYLHSLEGGLARAWLED